MKLKHAFWATILEASNGGAPTLLRANQAWFGSKQTNKQTDEQQI